MDGRNVERLSLRYMADHWNNSPELMNKVIREARAASDQWASDQARNTHGRGSRRRNRQEIL